MPDAIRLVFEYRNGEFQAHPPQHVRMVVPDLGRELNEPLPEGRFVELRSEDGAVLHFRRVAADMRSVEFPTGDPERPFGRTEPPAGSIITVVVPADREATHAALVDVAPAHGPGLANQSRRELVVVRLDRGGAR